MLWTVFSRSKVLACCGASGLLNEVVVSLILEQVYVICHVVEVAELNGIVVVLCAYVNVDWSVYK